ncbi:MAG: hypothetical protein NUW37_09025 [Planctomycetes bacterium]|nr:hypothetical protein [Planctomycetota bacterium]
MTDNCEEHHHHSIKAELSQHLPFSAGAAIIATGLAFALLPYLDDEMVDVAFDLAHPTHLFFSAAATTAMFFRHDKSIVKAILVGFVGALGVCSVSDIFIPWLGSLLSDISIDPHICLLLHPWRVILATLVGVALGLIGSRGVKRTTLYSHSFHVGISTIASILYLVAFGSLHDHHEYQHVSPSGDNAVVSMAEPGDGDRVRTDPNAIPDVSPDNEVRVNQKGGELGERPTPSFFLVAFVLLVAVYIPCCFSDIAFPMLFTKHSRLRSGERFEADVESATTQNPPGSKPDDPDPCQERDHDHDSV